MSAPEEMTLKVIAHIRTAFPTKVWHPAPERAGGQPAGRGHFYP